MYGRAMAGGCLIIPLTPEGTPKEECAHLCDEKWLTLQAGKVNPATNRVLQKSMCGYKVIHWLRHPVGRVKISMHIPSAQRGRRIAIFRHKIERRKLPRTQMPRSYQLQRRESVLLQNAMHLSIGARKNLHLIITFCHKKVFRITSKFSPDWLVEQSHPAEVSHLKFVSQVMQERADIVLCVLARRGGCTPPIFLAAGICHRLDTARSFDLHRAGDPPRVNHPPYTVPGAPTVKKCYFLPHIMLQIKATLGIDPRCHITLHLCALEISNTKKSRPSLIEQRFDFFPARTVTRRRVVSIPPEEDIKTNSLGHLS